MRWTRLYLKGMKLGFTTSELNNMHLGTLMCFVAADAQTENNAIKDGTQEDIQRLLC